MSDERGNLGVNLLVFLLGAATGALVVALTTPKSGPDLRADLKDLTNKVKHRVHEASRAFRPGCCEAEESEHHGA